MAQYQWKASDETLGQPPALLDNVCDNPISDWQVVNDVNGLNGRALQFVGASGLGRRRLALPGVTADGRVDVRGMYYKSGGISAGLHTFIRYVGTTHADASDYYIDVLADESVELGRYTPAYSKITDSGVARVTAPGWVYVRFTYDPAASPKFVGKMWDVGDVEANAATVTYDVAPSAVTGGRVGFGTGNTVEVTGPSYSWITVGTDGDDAADLAVPGGADNEAPTLSALTGTANGTTAANGSVTTSETGGTLYVIASTSATPPSVAQIQLGQNASGAAVPSTSKTVVATNETFSLTGLTASTTYYLHAQHKDAAGNDSTVVTSASFTTTAVAVKGVELSLYNGTTAQANLTGIRALWWDATAPTGAPTYETTTETTDALGVLTINLDAVTSLPLGGVGFLLLYQLNAVNHEDSRVFAGRVAISSI